jgi:hypothetical protein
LCTDVSKLYQTNIFIKSISLQWPQIARPKVEIYFSDVWKIQNPYYSLDVWTVLLLFLYFGLLSVKFNQNIHGNLSKANNSVAATLKVIRLFNNRVMKDHHQPFIDGHNVIKLSLQLYYHLLSYPLREP